VEDADALSQKSGAALLRLYQVAARLNGLNAIGEEKVRGNS
jgi:hypothetical protein